MTETPVPPPPGLVNRFKKPLGALPRHIQHVAIAGISIVMVIVIAFSGSRAPTKDPQTVPPAMGAVASPNEARIQEYREQIEAQVQRLAQEQARLRQTAEAAAAVPALQVAGGGGSGNAPPVYGSYGPAASASPERDWRAIDQERRHESRYASNIAFSHRARDRRNTAPEPAPRPPSAGPAAPDDGALRQAAGPMYRLMEGTVLETALVNRLDSSFSGPVQCQVTTNVYSRDRTKVLIPQGSRVLGQVRRVETFGEQRLAVSFERLLMPDGYSVALNTLPGLSQVGETGLLDQVNRHYGQIFGVSIAIGAIAGLAQIGTAAGPGATPADAYRQGVAGSLSQSSLNILERYLNVLPTFTVREGTRVKVYLTGDLLLPAYENHRMPRDL